MNLSLLIKKAHGFGFGDLTTESIMQTPARPIVPCGCCSGTGKVTLGDDLWTTLQRLDSTPRTTAELQEPGITRNAINNRLIALEAHGLAVSVGKQSKWRLWIATTTIAITATTIKA